MGIAIYTALDYCRQLDERTQCGISILLHNFIQCYYYIVWSDLVIGMLLLSIYFVMRTYLIAWETVAALQFFMFRIVEECAVPRLMLVRFYWQFFVRISLPFSQSLLQCLPVKDILHRIMLKSLTWTKVLCKLMKLS